MPDTVVLIPYYQEGYEYLWEDLSVNRDYNVQQEGTYSVVVTDAGGNGCSSIDSATVVLLFNDVGMDSLLYPFDHCGLSADENVTVRIRNFGTDSIIAGSEIPLYYKLNNIPAVSETIILPYTLEAGMAIDYEFTETAIDLSAKGSYTLKAFTGFAGDTINHNDTITKDISIFGYPSIDLGPDINAQALTYTLQTGQSFSSYLWSDGSTNSELEVSEGGTYWLKISDTNGCENSDTVDVFLKIRDVSAYELVSPVSDCSFSSSEQLVLKIQNSGTDTIPEGETIYLSYKQEEGVLFETTHILPGELLPGSNFNFQFPGTIDLGAEGDYPIVLSGGINNDMRPHNDTLETVVYRYQQPLIDFGLDEVEHIEDISFVIDAGYSPVLSYKWQDDSTRHAYTAVKSGTYHVKATDNRTMCYSADTVILFLIYNDVAVTSVNFPGEGCTGEYGNIVVRVTNTGSTNIGKDVPIEVKVMLNSEQAASKPLARTGNFAPGAYIDLPIDGNIRITDEGANTLSFLSIYDSDMKKYNDTLHVNFTGLPSPIVDFGDINGELNTSLPHILDAGSGHKEYLWQDASSNHSYTAVEPGTYTVTVTGMNDCQTVKSVRINPGTSVFNPVKNEDNIIIFPNPNRGVFTIEINRNITEDLHLYIYNSHGQLVFIENIYAYPLLKHEVNVQQLAGGVYSLILSGKQIIYRGRMIIE